jgi:lysophospholipase L1-like esterase
MKLSLIIILLSSAIVASASAAISATNPYIQVKGTKYTAATESGLQFQRHREDVLQIPAKELGINPSKARNTSGIVLAFKTDSKNIKVSFRIMAANYMGSGFGIFENGQLIVEPKLNPKATEAVLEFSATAEGVSLFEIVLPAFSNVEFLGLELDGDDSLQPVPNSEKKVYVALGDSISHGVGQDGYSHKTWPYLLAQKKDAELFNLAVGGGKISVPVAAMLNDWEQIDFITILIGYNDLHFDGKTPETYRSKYNELLDAIRTNHPETKIYCITPLYTKKPVSAKTGHTVDEFRNAVAPMIRQRQAIDKNLYLLEGDKITSEKNLRAGTTDPVHLSIEGAALLADELAKRIGKDET